MRNCFIPSFEPRNQVLFAKTHSGNQVIFVKMQHINQAVSTKIYSGKTKFLLQRNTPVTRLCQKKHKVKKKYWQLVPFSKTHFFRVETYG